MTETLATLDLHERPGQRITEYRYRRHGGVEGPIEGEAFGLGAHHSWYSYGEVMQPKDRLAQAVLNDAAAPRLETDSAKRKESPIFSGVIRYFPDALAEVARLSFEGNRRHNPDEPLHWARSKSTDELDCLARHLAEAGTIDTDGFYHDVKVAWRALANLQKVLEKARGLPISPGSRP